MSSDASSEPHGFDCEIPQTIEQWIEARLEDEERGAIKRLSIPDLYEDHFGGNWQQTLEAFKKLEAGRALRLTDKETDDEKGAAHDRNASELGPAEESGSPHRDHGDHQKR